MTNKFLPFIIMVLLTLSANAQDANLKIKFDFSKVNGYIVTDSASGYKAKIMNEATVVSFDKYHALDLGNGTGYFDLTERFGSLVKVLEDFTVSVYYRINYATSLTGSGHFLWSFAQSPANTETSAPYMAYRVNAQRYAISTGGWGNETGVEVGGESVKGRWVHMLYRQKGGHGELFVDGRLVAKAEGMPTPKKAYTGIPGHNWIGRPPFSGDSYLKGTLVTDFRLYDAAVSDEHIAELAVVAKQMEDVFRYSEPGDFTALVAKLKECETFIASLDNTYAPNAIAELKDEMSLAENELAYERASQTLIDQYVDNLDAAMKNVRATKGFVAKVPFDYVSERQGFVHPGGLVSQADIDRTKKMLADKDPHITAAWEILCNNQYSQSNVATWPTETVIRGIEGDNYMNCARGAAMAFQNALRWKIGGSREHGDAAVRIMMQWARTTKALGGNTNISLASGIYGYEFANAAELMRDYDGWSREEFEEFKRWMVKVWYNPAIDFLRRRHDTWMNFRHPSRGERPGHYWSNWGLCNVLCVMSIGILCDDVHMYNQGISFYKYDHQGTFTDRSSFSMIYNDGCNEFIGNLVPVVLPDERGPFGYLGQMQESGRDQGHSLMALGCALDICQIGFNQGDDLFAYMDDRIAAGTEYVAAQNFCGVAPADLPWIVYEYADCAGERGKSWQQPCADSRGQGEFRPIWDRVTGYYHGLRGVKLQFASKASEMVGPDGGGGNYSPNSGGFDHLGFTTLTHWRPLIDKSEAITPLSGDIIYNGKTYKNQTNLGGLKYKYHRGATNAIPADGAPITLVPQLPEGTNDTGKWEWNTGETTREIKVKADRSFLYRVTYTAENGAKSQQVFAIAVSGDAEADLMRREITTNGVVTVLPDDGSVVETKVLSGSSIVLFAEATTGWTDDYQWDDGTKGTIATVPNITSSRTYTCQFANQGGAISEGKFMITVVPAIQQITVDGATINADSVEVFAGTDVTLSLIIPVTGDADGIVWPDGTKGPDLTIKNIEKTTMFTVVYQDKEYVFRIIVKENTFSYFTDVLTEENGYTHILTAEQLEREAADSYFVICSDEADLMLGLADGKENGNKALYYQQTASPLNDWTKVFTIEPFDGGFCIRNIDYDGLLLQTEMNAAWNIRTHDQPYPVDWARFMMSTDGSAWIVENGMYAGNWLGLWTPENGYLDGEELACNKTETDRGHFQLFAIKKTRFHADLLKDVESAKDITVLVQNPEFEGLSWALWNVTGTFGNQRFNGAAETWHSTNFSMQQTLSLPKGHYTVSVQMANGEGSNTGYLFAVNDAETVKAVVKQSCAGSDFDTQRNRMDADSNYGRLSVDIALPEDGNLTFGIKEPTNGTTWLVFDNFTLTFRGSIADGIEEVGTVVNTTKAVYNLHGRKVGNSLNGLPKGVYIVNGRKVIL